MQKVILIVDGMTCSACSNGLEKYLNKQRGIHQATVNLVMGNALIEYDNQILTIGKIEKMVADAGFQSLGVWNEQSIEDTNQNEKSKWFFFTILMIVFLYIAMGHMIDLPVISLLDMHLNPTIYTITLFLFTLAFLYYGKDILKSGWNNLIHKTPNMDTLVSIGVTSSLLYSLYSTYQILNGNVTYIEQLYFESVGMIIYFIKLGRYIDKINKNKTKEAIQQLVQITPKEAVIIKDGKEQKVTIDEIRKGDILCCRPGEKVAVDGKITKGEAHMDEAFITGESKAVKKGVGEPVIAGSINYDGYLEYEAKRIGKDSTISEIVRLVMEATNTKAPIATLADQVSGYFVPTVMGIAFLTFLIYLCIGTPFVDSLNTFVTILVVACPCSLGLATPLAIVIAEGICAKNGILVKKSEILENAGKIDTIVLDKTGTITYGTPKIETIHLSDDIEEKELMRLTGSLESKSTHPIGKAFIDYMTEQQLQTYPVEQLEEISGHGIVGTIKSNQFLVGNAKLLNRFHIQNDYIEDEKRLTQNQNSIVYVVKNEKIIALIGINDVIRENVRQVIQQFQENKIEVIMLTGDHKDTANKVAERIGITHVIADVLPVEKASVIQNLKKENKYVMMCGDGINDSPALAHADIGVSIHSASDIASDSAGVILTHNDLYGILNLINISKQTIRNIKQNLFWAFFYNILMIPIAIGFFKPFNISMNPMFASLAMTMSSLTVILNALRLRNIRMI